MESDSGWIWFSLTVKPESASVLWSDADTSHVALVSICELSEFLGCWAILQFNSFKCDSLCVFILQYEVSCGVWRILTLSDKLCWELQCSHLDSSSNHGLNDILAVVISAVKQLLLTE